MAIRNALDHLLAWRSVLRAGVMPAYAHMSLLRTAYEAALLAYWLVEPGVDPATRHARGIAAREADYKERRKSRSPRAPRPLPREANSLSTG
jgi:hypothetical protein